MKNYTQKKMPTRLIKTFEKKFTVGYNKLISGRNVHFNAIV